MSGFLGFETDIELIQFRCLSILWKCFDLTFNCDWRWNISTRYIAVSWGKIRRWHSIFQPNHFPMFEADPMGLLHLVVEGLHVFWCSWPQKCGRQVYTLVNHIEPRFPLTITIAHTWRKVHDDGDTTVSIDSRNKTSYLVMGYKRCCHPRSWNHGEHPMLLDVSIFNETMPMRRPLCFCRAMLYRVPVVQFWI